MIYTKYILFSLLLVCPSVLSAQGITRRIHQIDEVTVWGKRPMKEIGVQKTKFDSLALKENIALSMADAPSSPPLLSAARRPATRR